MRRLVTSRSVRGFLYLCLAAGMTSAGLGQSERAGNLMLTQGTLSFSGVEDGSQGGAPGVAAGDSQGIRQNHSPLGALPCKGTISIDPARVLVDRFEGWGTSLCWWAHMVGGYSNRATYAKLIFSRLGINLVRYNIGGGENPNLSITLSIRARIPGFEPREGVWDWTADPNQRWMLREAIALGADRVVAFANSPPWWMTVSGSVSGATNGAADNLQPRHEGAFAAYLATVVSNLTVLDHVRFDLVTPMNEPASTWWVCGGIQEGCHMSPAQQARLVNLLRRELDVRGLSATGIAASEDNDEQLTIDSLSAYPSTALGNVACVATHSYGANNPEGVLAAATRVGKPLWMSEYGDPDASGLVMARRIHDDLTQARVRAWIYWQAVDNASGWGFLYNPLDGSGNAAYVVNQKYHVMWQFSHFIRNGSSLLETGDPDSLAAYDPSSHSLVIVTVNDSTNSFGVRYDLSKFAAVGAEARRYRTSESERALPLPALNLTNRQFVAPIPPRSVTTHVIAGQKKP